MDGGSPGGEGSGAERNFLQAMVSDAKKTQQEMVLDHVSPATRLLEKRRQMFEVQEALEQQKLEFNRKEDTFRRRENGLKKQDLDLQESLIRFSKFLQENDAKRARAERKAQEELRLAKQKVKEIDALQETLDGLKDEKEQTLEVLDKNLQYQQFLEQVLETVDEYQEISDLLMRYATLNATNEDVRKQQFDTEEASERLRAELLQYSKMKTDEILNLNNQISQLKKQLEAHQLENLDYESKKDHSLQVASTRTLEYGQVCMATTNLFNRCRELSKIAHANLNSPVEQLEVVGNYVADLGAIIKYYKSSHK
mmetsp:Transcript_14208/g.36465  ORF Transcript_14208/g.36465 Transcript_14208/m.36465 type:complete len:311 (+) Transcript_14208:219-1151(+)|eukprot:jgi/Tetstr1/465681/TSEL_010324.t1